MERDSFVFYYSFYDAGRDLSDQDRLDYYDRILNYGILGVEKTKGKNVEMLFKLIKPLIDANNKRYVDGCKGGKFGVKGKPYGKLGGRPKKENPPQGDISKPPQNPPNDNEDVNDNVNEELNTFINKWNSIKQINGKRGLPEVRKINKEIVATWDSRRKEYSVEDIIQATNNYCVDISKRVKRDDFDAYPDHRFTLLEFLVRKDKGITKFINL